MRCAGSRGIYVAGKRVVPAHQPAVLCAGAAVPPTGGRYAWVRPVAASAAVPGRVRPADRLKGGAKLGLESVM
ncbi:hypothetical protein BDY21DRAFT_358403 [Lineolata rhizophorae]|uniref:Uncharacterized protein n=1 Tax=Lineolata rhizophorae TaxID=578093 RepID=A0A6A6NLS0_9PEZI|nr:hypothetical protein BDY21DRAFT_358403 [Lineolata rhizophorae]